MEMLLFLDNLLTANKIATEDTVVNVKIREIIAQNDIYNKILNRRYISIV